jgi:hypothetical protein
VLEVGKSSDQGRLVFAQNHLWVLNGPGDQAIGINPETNEVGPIVDLGTRCTDLAAADNDFIWAACPIDGAGVRIDPSGDPVRANALLPGARQVAVDGWGFVGYDDGIAQLHPETMEVVARYDVTPGLGGAIWAGGDQLWVRRQEGPFLTRIDPVAVGIDEVIEAEGVTSGGDVLVAFD